MTETSGLQSQMKDAGNPAWSLRVISCPFSNGGRVSSAIDEKSIALPDGQ